VRLTLAGLIDSWGWQFSCTFPSLGFW